MKKISIFLLTTILLFSNTVIASTNFSDIEGSWAQEAIIRLSDLGVFEGVYNESFQPNNNVTLDELIELAAKCFNLSSAEQQALYSWLDHFMPEADLVEQNDTFITRTELIAAAANLLNLSKQSINVDEWEQSFEDVDPNHPLFTTIELINKLDVLPIYVMNHFEPERLSTRAEVAAIFDAIMNLETVAGEVVEVRKPANWIIINTGSEQFRYLPVEADTIILRNGETKQIEQIKTGDQLNALYDIYGSVAVVNVTPTLANNNLLQSLTGLLQKFRESPNIETLTNAETLQVLQQILTPEQIAAIISGDWTTVSDGFRHNLSAQLIELGLTPWETDALLSQDWTSLKNMGVDRAALIFSDYLGVTPEIFYSAINQNWEQLLEYAQIEIAQRLLSGVSM